ncbi:NAD-dependent epimerase/dehydratase family protein [Methanospirillum sp.]|uniref:NAD-dependent epimerase/dehydratase family protein n=1 Tax=Methanospirillum sp. TaxID=45200 RepID=UPI0035A1AB21
MSKKIIVIGGSGFIGNALQQYVIEHDISEKFAFSYHNHEESIKNGLGKIYIDLLNPDCLDQLKNFSTVIYVAGNADHSIAHDYPLVDLNLNTVAFLNFINNFNGSLVLLSTQAIYYGLNGEIFESIKHLPTIPYGISKQAVESYASYFLNSHHLTKLWIFRLMNSYGPGEKSRRIIPRCAKACLLDDKVTINGGGKSYLNPLPSWFIAKILSTAAFNMFDLDDGFLEITNLNHKINLTVLELVQYLHMLKPFNYSVINDGEEWPVHFWGNTSNLSEHLKKWNFDFPGLHRSIQDYYLSLIISEVKE